LGDHSIIDVIIIYCEISLKVELFYKGGKARGCQYLKFLNEKIYPKNMAVANLLLECHLLIKL